MAGTYEPVYRAQAGASSAPLPGASPDAFGAAVGEGLEKLGGAIDRTVISDHALETRVERETQSADAGVRMAKIGTRIEQGVQDLRANPQAGAAGHSEAVNGLISQFEPQMFDGITNEHVRNAYREEWAQMASRISAREYGWQTGMQVDHSTDQLGQQTQVLADAQAVRPDVDAWSQGLDQIRTNWQNAPGGVDVQERGIRAGQRDLTLAYARSLVRTDHAQFTAQAGTLAQFGHLTPQDLDELERGSETEQRRDEAAQRAAAAQARAQAEQSYNLYHTQQAAGVELTPAQLEEYTAAARASENPSHLFDAQQGGLRQNINRETQTWTAQDWDNNINQLAALPHRTPEQDVTLDQLRTIRSARVTELNSDPAGAAARAGTPMPPIADIDHVSPAEFNARAGWARGFAQSHHLAAVPYLDANDMRHYREQLDTGGDAATLQVAQSLRGNWGVGVGTEIARQMGDHANELTLMVGLPDNAQLDYGLGRQALERNRDLFKEDDAREIFQEIQDAIPPQMRDAAFKASRNIVAAMLDRAGQGSFDGDIYRMALHRSLGALHTSSGVMTGGIGTLNGAHLWLPPDLSQAELERRITSATGPQWEQASVNDRGQPTANGPRIVGADGRPGRPLYTAELRNAHFSTIAPGVYTLPGAVDARGRPWRFDIRRLAPPLWNRR